MFPRPHQDNRSPSLASLGAIAAIAVIGLAACSSSLTLDPGGVTGAELGAPSLEIVVLAGDDLSVIPASVAVNGKGLVLDSVGSTTIGWPEGDVVIEVGARGFRSWTEELRDYPAAGRIEFRLDPVVLSGRVTTNDGIALPGATVALGAATDETDDEGRFQLERAAPGEIHLSRPAWESATHEWDGRTETAGDLQMSPIAVRALRVSGEKAGSPAGWAEILSLADLTGIDALVVDVKDETGTVLHDTEVSAAHEIGAVKAFYDIDNLVRDMDERSLYKIARIVVFQDTLQAQANSDHAVTTGDGGLWETAAGHNWLDPSDPAAYEYAVDLGAEACRRGFDEIQFDYVSFPFGGDLSDATFDGAYTEEVRVASVLAFLDRAHSVLSPAPLQCAVGANVLAITLESPTDENVGQRPGAMSRTVDVLSPMIYTTNYGPGWKGMADPNEHALTIVNDALRAGERKLEGYAYYRPWLQTWVLSDTDARGVQGIAEDLGMGWMLWSNASSFSANTLPSR